jgi:FkbM family methyltransferase
VATTSIDEILADAGVEKVDVLKIDVEGYEVRLLSCVVWVDGEGEC